ncbi:uncharacterized protein LACBIDRAFT_333522 [Laccaria bicolor S238N-H82]|uniref:Predicted protein n=1 Tax=Laccaria bicolor (strain S238N-H82 / ATCC MYA-4686) TaxID=486041 RepID=B0DW67_LACBS|nr:uncharacterized protein LACBIDRAFT_333522 [Laccaria bicolor S238N-H82]EDR01130.1 predicted protein [Laccaria bicolor S238N-H82]|eukprot:XP_001888172.1 predicted protein [Laccaria bicolor S238N-H82]
MAESRNCHLSGLQDYPVTLTCIIDPFTENVVFAKCFASLTQSDVRQIIQRVNGSYCPPCLKSDNGEEWSDDQLSGSGTQQQNEIITSSDRGRKGHHLHLRAWST